MEHGTIDCERRICFLTENEYTLSGWFVGGKEIDNHSESGPRDVLAGAIMKTRCAQRTTVIQERKSVIRGRKSVSRSGVNERQTKINKRDNNMRCAINIAKERS